MQELGPNQEKWLRALESGEYQQGYGKLANALGTQYCCLGVGCVVLGMTQVEDGAMDCLMFGVDGEATMAPDELQSFLALYDPNGRIGREIRSASGGYGSLTKMNDDHFSFRHIAQFCRDEPELVFSEPR